MDPPLPGKLTPLHPDHFHHQGALWRHSMRRYSETVKAEVKRRMGPPQRQSVAQISKEFGIHVAPTTSKVVRPVRPIHQGAKP
jgi:transposase-like protein